MSLLCLSPNGYGMNPLRRQHQQQHVTFVLRVLTSESQIRISTKSVTSILRVLTSESQIWISTQIPTLPPNIRRHQLLFTHALLVRYNNCYVTKVKPTRPAKFEYPMWNIRGGGEQSTEQPTVYAIGGKGEAHYTSERIVFTALVCSCHV